MTQEPTVKRVLLYMPIPMCFHGANTAVTFRLENHCESGRNSCGRLRFDQTAHPQKLRREERFHCVRMRIRFKDRHELGTKTSELKNAKARTAVAHSRSNKMELIYSRGMILESAALLPGVIWINLRALGNSGSVVYSSRSFSCKEPGSLQFVLHGGSSSATVLPWKLVPIKFHCSFSD